VTEPWPFRVVRILFVFALNAVPIWGYTEQAWSPGTALALYWLQSLFSIPMIALLILLHRRATHKYGHYNATTTTSVNGGPAVTRRSTFLDGFLWMSIPFVIAHGIFLAFLLGMLWQNAAGGVDREDLRLGAMALINIMALNFAFEAFNIARRPFAWVRRLAQTQLQRTFVVQFVIIFGMAGAAFASKEAQAFFAVFLALKLFFDVLFELPEWNPKEPPHWIVWLYGRFGDKGGDIHSLWKKWRTEQKDEFDEDERSVDPATLPDPR
jgi:hypothetical protein